MADFSEHNLIMIQRWQRMHGTNQWKQGGLTPSKDNSDKASPLNKKKKKSSGGLFPSPKDTNLTYCTGTWSKKWQMRGVKWHRMEPWTQRWKANKDKARMID
jgi:hypothetical protein